MQLSRVLCNFIELYRAFRQIYAYLSDRSCKIAVDRSRKQLRNCKTSCSSIFANKSGDWSSGGITIEALGEGTYSHDLAYNVQWNN